MSSPRAASEREPRRSSAATRLSSWAANLLASGLILVAGLALGRQVLEWWKPQNSVSEVASAGASSYAPDVGDPHRPHVFEIGELPFALRRSHFQGKKQDALATLRARGVEALSQPFDLSSEPGLAERRMLSRLGPLRPTLAEAGRWEMYQLDGPILLVAGVRLTNAPTAVLRPPESLGRRVVYWGFGVPVVADGSPRQDSWSLYSYGMATDPRSSGANMPDISLPPGARRTLSLATDDGARLIAFQGMGNHGAWQRHFDGRLKAQGWSRPRDWLSSSVASQARFGTEKFTAHIQWGTLENGEFSGIVTLAPIP